MYEAQIKNLEKARLGQKRVSKLRLVCNLCSKEFLRYPKEIGVKNYCSKICSNKDHSELMRKSRTGVKMSEKTKNKLKAYKGENTSSWKGGRPKCKICKKEIWYRRTYCSKHKHLLWTKEKWEKAWEGSRKKTGIMPANIMRPGKFMNVVRGWFDIDGVQMFFRSKWEVNYAKYLNWLKYNKNIKNWEYEKDTFIFHKIQSGTRSYKPDFKIENNDGTFEYHEVKGWMTPKSKTQLNRMRIYYPETKLILIDRRYYTDLLKKMNRMIDFI